MGESDLTLPQCNRVYKQSVEVAIDGVLPPWLRQLNLHRYDVTPPVSRDRKKADFNVCGQSGEIIPQPFIEQDICELTNAPSTCDSRAMLQSDTSLPSAGAGLQRAYQEDNNLVSESSDL